MIITEVRLEKKDLKVIKSPSHTESCTEGPSTTPATKRCLGLTVVLSVYVTQHKRRNWRKKRGEK